jgi:hypothetical protein
LRGTIFAAHSNNFHSRTTGNANGSKLILCDVSNIIELNVMLHHRLYPSKTQQQKKKKNNDNKSKSTHKIIIGV